MTISRVEDFYTKIKNMDGLKDIKKAAILELEYLNDNCGSIGSLKTTLSNYKSYLKDHFHNKKVSKRNVGQFLCEVLKLTEEQSYGYNIQYLKKVKLKNTQRRKIYDSDLYLNKAKSLLSAISVYDRILGLCALTGRRSAEIGCSAIFKETADEGFIEFDGQLKTKGKKKVKPYKIPVLANFYDLNNTLISIREVKPFFINNPRKFNKIASKDLGMRARKHFSDFIEGHVQVKDLRAIYAAITYDNYLKSSKDGYSDMSDSAFFAKYLGHSEDDLHTCTTYKEFCVKQQI